ncbi:MAG: glycosyltransferase family 2 protein, partial [Lachnospiraceae bacterium]|nr:glycosyltransferase family 2 protein [Lachnospiraceae bacterium]
MISVSLCMIVKNEEAVLRRCLDSVADLMDEIIIVDTGSTDKTKAIAGEYTDKVYDFEWINDFSAARNFAFSKANRDYIYSADADEVLDEENRRRFKVLKENMLPEIEIVQMKYGNQLHFGTVYNFDEEYRPKLFKRVREFQWIEPIHETIRTSPVVYDSDIVITHMPTSEHGSRDLQAFHRQISSGKGLSRRLREMYARELFMVGEKEDLLAAEDYFAQVSCQPELSTEEYMECYSVLTRVAHIKGDVPMLMKYAMKAALSEGCSEVCLELGHFYEHHGDAEEACIWFYNAAFETMPILVKDARDRVPLEGLVRIYEGMGLAEQAAIYKEELQ